MEAFFSRKSNQVLFALALLMIIIALGAYAQHTWKQARYAYFGPVTISVTGEGEVTAVPDIGEFNFSVQEEGAEVVAVQEAAATKINSIIAYLKEAGVAEKDIRNVHYSLTPRYRFETRICPAGMFCPPGEQVQDGFVVNHSVQVKVRDLAQAGELISAVGEREVSYISGLSFTIDDESALRAEARAEAIADAKAKAEVLAEQLGVRVGKMVSFQEGEEFPQPYWGMRGDMAKTVAMEGAVTPDIPLGENIINSQVTITYRVR